MRVRLRDDLHAVGRPGGAAALGAALGGVVAAWSPRATAWSLVATVDAVGTAGESTVASLSAIEVTPLAWAATGVGLVVTVIAVLVAIDRPPPGAERLLLLSAVGMLAITMAVIVARPGPDDFAAHGRAADLVAGSSVLPAGVEIELTVEPAPGPILLGTAALVVAGGALVALRRG